MARYKYTWLVGLLMPVIVGCARHCNDDCTPGPWHGRKVKRPIATWLDPVCHGYQPTCWHPMDPECGQCLPYLLPMMHTPVESIEQHGLRPGEEEVPIGPAAGPLPEEPYVP